MSNNCSRTPLIKTKRTKKNLSGFVGLSGFVWRTGPAGDLYLPLESKNQWSCPFSLRPFNTVFLYMYRVKPAKSLAKSNESLVFVFLVWGHFSTNFDQMKIECKSRTWILILLYQSERKIDINSRKEKKLQNKHPPFICSLLFLPFHNVSTIYNLMK